MQRVLTTLILGTALGASVAGIGACGGARTTPVPSSPTSLEAKSAPEKKAESTEAIIGDLLANLGDTKSSASTPSATQAAAVAPAARVQATPVSADPTPSTPTLDPWTRGVDEIKSRVPTWDNGSGVVVKFLKESSGERLSLVYVDPTPPVLHTASAHWIIQAKAMADGKAIGHILFALKDLSPGRHEGNPTQQDAIIAAEMAETWDGRNPETTWSTNPGSWCEITLRVGRNPEDLEGDFRGKLVDNSGKGYHTIESGYVYINR